MKSTNEKLLKSCGLCYQSCSSYSKLNNQSYCKCTGRLTTPWDYCHALKSTKGSKIIEPFDKFPDKINENYKTTTNLINIIGKDNYSIIESCAILRGSSLLFDRSLSEFNWFVKVITIGNTYYNCEFNQLYILYHEHYNEPLDKLISLFHEYCIDYYGKLQKDYEG